MAYTRYWPRPADVREAVSRALMDGRFERVPEPARALKELIRTLEKSRLVQMEREYQRALEQAKQQGDQEALRALMARSVELARIKQGLGEAPQRP